jgi:hypothetical protein
VLLKHIFKINDINFSLEVEYTPKNTCDIVRPNVTILNPIEELKTKWIVVSKNQNSLNSTKDIKMKEDAKEFFSQTVFAPVLYSHFGVKNTSILKRISDNLALEFSETVFSNLNYLIDGNSHSFIKESLREMERSYKIIDNDSQELSKIYEKLKKCIEKISFLEKNYHDHDLYESNPSVTFKCIFKFDDIYFSLDIESTSYENSSPIKKSFTIVEPVETKVTKWVVAE